MGRSLKGTRATGPAQPRNFWRLTCKSRKCASHWAIPQERRPNCRFRKLPRLRLLTPAPQSKAATAWFDDAMVFNWCGDPFPNRRNPIRFGDLTHFVESLSVISSPCVQEFFLFLCLYFFSLSPHFTRAVRRPRNSAITLIFPKSGPANQFAPRTAWWPRMNRSHPRWVLKS